MCDFSSCESCITGTDIAGISMLMGGIAIIFPGTCTWVAGTSTECGTAAAAGVDLGAAADFAAAGVLNVGNACACDATIVSRIASCWAVSSCLTVICWVVAAAAAAAGACDEGVARLVRISTYWINRLDCAPEDISVNAATDGATNCIANASAPTMASVTAAGPSDRFVAALRPAPNRRSMRSEMCLRVANTPGAGIGRYGHEAVSAIFVRQSAYGRTEPVRPSTQSSQATSRSRSSC